MRKWVGFCVGLLLLTNTAAAQVTTVDGVGVDKDSAVRDAVRNAVENVVGTFIDSRTLVSQSVVALDEVYAKSQGFVKDIKILREFEAANNYKVTAQIDVDTNPNSQLLDKLNMIMLLNDPRIAVVVLKDVDGEIGNDEISETALNDKLIELGFSHVIDANMVAKLQNSELLNSIYNGQRGLVEDINSYGVDYLVLGKSKAKADNIQIPGKNRTYTNTLLYSGNASINVKIIKFDTGDIVGTFSIEGQGVERNSERSADKALQAVAIKAAEKLEEKFKKLPAASSQGMQLIVSTNDYSKIERLVDELRNLSSVQNVYIREYNGSKAILELDTNQKPHFVLRSLKENSKLGIFMEKISNNSMQLIVS